MAARWTFVGYPLFRFQSYIDVYKRQLIYSLPQTHLDIEVVATKTTRKAGPYYQYAEKYLGIPGAITQDSEEWALSSVKVTPYGVPDPEEQYLMQFKPGGNGYIVLDENGLLLSINTEPVSYTHLDC